MQKSDTVVRFYEHAQDALFRYAVILSRCRGKWVFCRHRERDTWEVPGGHREQGEEIEAAARRELYEETGAVKYALSPVCAYSVTGSVNAGEERFGMLYSAEIEELGPLPPFEIAEIRLFDRMPDRLTYPDIQPALFRRAVPADNGPPRNFSKR